jgi:hypothetical protein
MHDALKAADPDHPLIVEAEQIICNVPQCRATKPADYVAGMEWI